MTGTVPPRLFGPRMAVWGYFPFDNRVVTADGKRATWEWAMSQWDEVARAGHAVRLVVAEQAYSRLDTNARVADAKARFSACRAAEQLVFGRVYVAGGKLQPGQPGEKFDDPLRPGRQVPGVADQIAAWHTLYGDQIDGIYLDSGPTACTDPSVAGGDPVIPRNYRAYVAAARPYYVFVQAAQYPDGEGWLRALGAEFLELWEAGVAPYSTKFEAKDACHPGQSGVLPAWWDEDTALRWSRVHVVDDCRDSATMNTMARLAIDRRGAWTVWITRPRRDDTLGAVYDSLPPYWLDEVAFFRRYADDEDRAAKSTKDTQDEKRSKDEGDQKGQKDDKDHKDDPDNKASKDDKDVPDQVKDDKDNKDNKEAKDKEDVKEDTKDEPELTDKQQKDTKDFKDDDDNPKPLETLKDSELAFKVLETVGLDVASAPVERPEAEAGRPLGRTFIRPHERPVVGESIVADPPGSEE
ncbi:hypothetical protein [Amycolatopsis pithecellobii]|uniref:Uncharacterized protein n=1 Tax=Amycolatopsis pithecellobii TaxID=664692 RepID=A0A6N7Z6M2_9PSEU|nr:hypothetical protein [Amycolatopsis pithecellobii]MTD55246.1 hypothetical protein [Amycolatopsis pithecellobii]